MSNIISAINDDIDEYIYLCEKYNEKPETDKSGINPYCFHARQLKQRRNKEWEQAWKEQNRD